ncbi:eukaryotic translation initiation factor 5B isoform X2 [Neocloeon triangulifer]|uniref:eukaryotic translation initiation factor 5B isoform X2 n=1 Tax=Neocloeon triangulifer TaxID=2078957 RepID=UPI00286F627A|nr:eukaryotic translation initiation factor 5B isoform X2 [Neocloeon triangulifer]
MVKAKRGKKAVKDGSDDSDIEVDDVAEEVGNSSKNKTKKKANIKPGFALLAAEDDDMIQASDDDDDKEDSEEEEKEETKPAKSSKKGKKAKPDPEPVDSDEEEGVKQKAGKKGKKKKKKEDSDEELEKMLAELKMEYTGEKESTPEAGAPKDKKKEVKAEPQAEADEEQDGDAEEGGENQSTVKSAAQKKREKREREKANKKAQKTKPDEVSKPAEEPTAEEVEKEEEVDDEGKKKKGKKGAVDTKEEKKPSKKNKMIEALKEAQRKQQEEEERLRILAEEEEKRLQAEEEVRLEAERKELERKEKKKQKEKERKERLKAEGKLLTPKQKADRARAQAMLEALGVSAPAAGEKKVRPGTRIRPNKKNQQQQQQDASSEANDDAQGKEQNTTGNAETAAPVEEVKDSWDLESDNESENKVEEVKKAPEPEAKVELPEPTEQKESSSEEEEEESESESESETDDEELEHMTDAEKKRAKAVARIQKRRADAEKNRTPENLRAAVICVLGHVDTGKTKILDKLRRTSVQAGEAGGITQQIGATNVPIENIKEQTKIVKGYAQMDFKLPGLLIIDTPGHASFSNLRSRGSSLCDMAILVVDIMHGLEEQTIESLNLLKAKKTPFVVALNKIDRLYDWTTVSRKDIRDVISSQASNTQAEFQRRAKEVVLQFAEQGMNAALFYDNPDPRSYVSLVPTSAITGEGMGNLLALLVTNCQSMLTKRLMFSEELQATVLEVKAITGLGTTIDCILVNGRIREGDTIVLAASDGGAVVTQIRSLLMPQPMKELRVKNDYIEYKEVVAAQGVKIAAKDLEKVIAGLNILVAKGPEEIEICREEVVRDLARELGRIKLQDRGVLVQASTLGSLEALLEFLKDSKIPYSSVKIGPVVKKDVMRASTMLERESQYGTILAFDVKVERDAQDLADHLGVKIFQADIIYHLFDQFTAHREQLRQQLRQQNKHVAVFPCKLKILPQYIFNSRDPIVMGVIVEDGIVCVGTPICVQSKEDPTQILDLGIVTSIESNHKSVENARRGLEVCIKIENTGEGAPKMFGRHFDEKDVLLSKISRQSIDACKEYFRDDLIKSDWQLMVELKKLFQIL